MAKKLWRGLPSLTQKQFRDDTDINKIMAKYQKGEAITHLQRRQGRYGDFSQIRDYRASLDHIIETQKAFMALPSGVRKRFQNDPQELINFVNDKNNYNEAVELGLIEKKISTSDTSNASNAIEKVEEAKK